MKINLIKNYKNERFFTVNDSDLINLSVENIIKHIFSKISDEIEIKYDSELHKITSYYNGPEKNQIHSIILSDTYLLSPTTSFNDIKNIILDFVNNTRNECELIIVEYKKYIINDINFTLYKQKNGEVFYDTHCGIVGFTLFSLIKDLVSSDVEMYIQWKDDYSLDNHYGDIYCDVLDGKIKVLSNYNFDLSKKETLDGIANELGLVVNKIIKMIENLTKEKVEFEI